MGDPVGPEGLGAPDLLSAIVPRQIGDSGVVSVLASA